MEYRRMAGNCVIAAAAYLMALGLYMTFEDPKSAGVGVGFLSIPVASAGYSLRKHRH